ncbi:glutamate-rich WD repeat-containing protein 1-like isoform X2 [Anneissia japonica]|uniref:glutamate-rich WD repeat-containing protein 1-like isoform X2 n=1 Tax=Anneissia japonica TaxID=1529436 RepID=UPI00142572CE|nr:glutamate-rich WD repeat-containing protein 1-like isoform X2 [Anneissia japonica]
MLKLDSTLEQGKLIHILTGGTQAEKSHLNNVIVMKMCNLHKNSKDSSSDSESEEDEDEEEMPELKTDAISISGSVNRLRVTKIADKEIAACWCETGRVHIFDLSPSLKSLEVTGQRQPSKSNPLHTFAGHQIEGYAIDWSRLVPGRLASGDCKKNIHVWKLQDGGSWHIDQRPFTGHTDSVEDIQWSPNESNVFASCSVDSSIRIWDIRAVPSQACMLSKDAHSSDVNVISWNRKDPFILSGGDDGVISVWDLRQFKTSPYPVAKFKHHTGPITSVEWHPTDSTVFAASGADDQLTLWDLAVERNQEADSASAELAAIPPQLLFIHQGQKDIKELHWHPQIAGVIISTALSGFNIFRTISV